MVIYIRVLGVIVDKERGVFGGVGGGANSINYDIVGHRLTKGIRGHSWPF